MKMWQRRLFLTGKTSSKVAARSNRLLFVSGLDNFLSEAAFRMPPEIRSGAPISFVLISLNELILAPAIIFGSADKDLAYTTISLLNGGIVKE